MFKFIASIFTSKTPFLKHYNRIANEIKKGKLLTKDGNRYSKFTAYNYKSGASRFKLWEKEYGTIYIEDINPAWAERFAIFQMEKNYCKNSIAGCAVRLKAVLHRLHDSGISKYNGSGIRTSFDQVTTVYSTIEEIRSLLEVDLNDTPGLSRVRYIYVLQCFLGLRFGDMRMVLANPKQYLRYIGGKYYFEVKTQKTGEMVVIPTARIVLQILELFEYDFGEIFSFQYYNDAIKVVARKAGITEVVIFTRTKGGRREDNPYEKCTHMSSHTARRTFATNAFLSGLTEKNIMMITGHKTTQSFHRYIRCSNLEAAIKVANHDFFNIDLPTPFFLMETVSKNTLSSGESNPDETPVLHC